MGLFSCSISCRMLYPLVGHLDRGEFVLKFIVSAAVLFLFPFSRTKKSMDTHKTMLNRRKRFFYLLLFYPSNPQNSGKGTKLRTVIVQSCLRISTSRLNCLVLLSISYCLLVSTNQRNDEEVLFQSHDDVVIASFEPLRSGHCRHKTKLLPTCALTSIIRRYLMET